MVPTIREIAELAGISQIDLARRFDIPYRTVSNWARGERDCAEYIRKMMCEILNIKY